MGESMMTSWRTLNVAAIALNSDRKASCSVIRNAAIQFGKEL